MSVVFMSDHNPSSSKPSSSREESRASRVDDELLNSVYGELKRLAAAKLSREAPDHTLQATALVHEVWIKLDGRPGPHAASGSEERRNYLAAAACAMQRILVDHARRRLARKRGGGAAQHDIDIDLLPDADPREDLIALDEALGRLNQVDPPAAEVVRMRYFAGLPIAEIAETLGISPRSADRLWAYARAWLFAELER